MHICTVDVEKRLETQRTIVDVEPRVEKLYVFGILDLLPNIQMISNT